MATVTRYVNVSSPPGGNGTTSATSGTNRAYQTLNEWEAATQTTGTDIYEVICGGAGADSVAVTIDGWAVSSPGYILIRCADAHGGAWNTGVYRHEATVTGILIREQYVRIENLQIGTNSTNTAQYVCIEFDSNLDADTRGYVSRCIIKNIAATTGKRYGVWLDSNNGKYYISNNVLYDFAGHANSAAIRNALELTEAYVYQNTICGCESGWYASAGLTLCRLSNNLFQDNTNSVNNSSGTAFHSSSDYNVCDDNGTGNYLVPGASSIKSTEVAFANEVGDDFHTSDVAAKVSNNLYSDANLPITLDIDGAARPSSGSVYAGADEGTTSTSDSYSAATLTLVGAVPSPMYTSDASYSLYPLELAAAVNSITVDAFNHSTHHPSELGMTAALEGVSVAVGGPVEAGTLSAGAVLEAPTVSTASTAVTVSADALSLSTSLHPASSPSPNPMRFVPLLNKDLSNLPNKMSELSRIVAEFERRLRLLEK